MTDNKLQKERLEFVYTKYSNLLYRIALVQLGNKQDAEDAVQDTFIKYLSGSFKFSGENEERAWITRVLVNTCRDMQRRRKFRGWVPLDELIDLPAESEENRGVFDAISKLSDKYRTTIILHYLEDFSVEEISKALSLSPSGVKMRLLRGREELLNILGKENKNV